MTDQLPPSDEPVADDAPQLDSGREQDDSPGRPGLVEAVRSAERFRFTTTRPVAVLMVFLAILVFGAFSVRLLPLNLMPEISYPKLTVRADYEGAAPAEVENDVARHLEDVLGVVTGVTQVSSVSRAGFVDVILEFSWDTDMDDANQDVLEKIDQIKPLLPDEVEQPLILRYDPTLDPVLVLSLSGEGELFEGTAGLKYLRRLADRDVRRLLEPIEGVAAVKVKGGLEEEISIELDEDALRRTRIGTAQVIQRLQAENINLAGGSMREGKTRYLIRTVNEFRDLDDLRKTVILSTDGKEIRLEDLAEVSLGYKDREVITRVGGVEAVEVEVYKEADANIVEMAKEVRTRIDQKIAPRLEQEHGAQITVVSDRSLFIESSVQEVLNTAIIGGLLAIIVLFLFLRDFKTTAIVAVAIPMSVVITFAPLSLSGVSLNIMSLGGMALGIGMLVDNSIVVLESIYRCVEEGDDIMEATVRGTAEVGSAVLASTLTSIAVFFPMVFVEGVAGQMFGDLGLTVVFSLMASLAVALFFIPMLASRRFTGTLPDGERGFVRGILQNWSRWNSVKTLVGEFKPFKVAKLLLVPYLVLRFGLHLVFELVGKIVLTFWVLLFKLLVTLAGGLGWVLKQVLRPLLWVFEKGLNGVTTAYKALIRWSLHNAVTIVGLVGLAFGGMVFGGMQLDSELIPELHQGEFTVELTFPVGTPLDETDALVDPLEDKMLEDTPRLRAMVTSIGSESDSDDSGDKGEHTAKLKVSLLAGGGQAAAAGGVEGKSVPPDLAEQEALDVIRAQLATIPDVDANITRPALFSFKTPVEVEVRGYDLDDLGLATSMVEEKLQAIPGLRDVQSTIAPGNPEVQIIYDREALSRLGLDIRSVAELVRDKIQGTEATKFNKRDRKIPVRVRLADVETAGIEELENLVVNPGGARPIPLEAVATIVEGRGPNEIRRIGQQRVGVVTANVEGIGLGVAADRIAEGLGEITLPSGTSTAVTGQSEEWETSSRSLYLALILSVFLVYVIMASQFESLIYPLIILVSIPLAFVGVVAVLLVLNMPLSVLVFLGAIMLAGIVVNNAIVLVDYINQLKARGHAVEQAIELAGQVRLRPILMTTLTTVLGLVPMALGLGDGAEIRQPMAVTVIAGLAFSTVLTLVVIPTLYYAVDRLFGKRLASNSVDALDVELAGVTAAQVAPEDFAGDEQDDSDSGPDLVSESDSAQSQEQGDEPQ